MTLARTSAEVEKIGAKAPGSTLSDNTSPRSTHSRSFATRSPSSSSLHSNRASPTIKLRYRQLIQPITPTELEPEPGTEPLYNSVLDDEDQDSRRPSTMRYPRVELSSLDLAKPRIYTRLLYFFQASPISSASSTTTGNMPLNSPPSTPPSSSRKKVPRQKSRHPYHHSSVEFMDPMLLQASLALVLSDFFPLAGRLCGNGSGKPWIECNDRGVLFAVADTTLSMQQIQAGDFQDSVLPPQLHPVGLYPASLRDPPLLGIQLTYTQDRSLIMGVAMDSSVMDATSLVSFLEAWSKITQGKDFSPFPILDRSFLEKLGQDAPAATYRHQRINDSPPPPIMFDNDLDQGLGTGLGDSDLTSEDDDNDDDDDEEEQEEDDGYSDGNSDEAAEDAEDDESGAESKGESNLLRVQKQMDQLSAGSNTYQGLKAPKVIVVEADEKDHEDMDAILQEPEGNSLHLFHFTAAQLDRIKKLASEQNIAAAACAADDKEISDKWVSTGDSLIAYLWKMTTITRRMEPDCKLMCGVVMDIRNKVTPVIPDGFIGNAILSIFVQMPVHSLLTTPLSLPSRLIRDELLVQTPEQIRSAIRWIQKQEHPHLIETSSNNPFGHDFMVWSFRKLNMYSPDFGHGPPIKVRIGKGGFGGGEGMCIIMDGEPSRSSPTSGSGVGSSSATGGSNSSPGVDVYLGIQGEHLLDFEAVHNGFMEGLLEPGASGGEWEVI